METLLPLALSEIVHARYARLIARCREVGVAVYDDAGVAEHVQRVLLASDFAYDSFLRQPELLGSGLIALMSDPRHADVRAPQIADNAGEAVAMTILRRYRRAEALRLIWRDVNGLDSVDETLAGASALAETCLAAALEFGEHNLALRHGTPRGETGAVQKLVVFGLGKLGGGELNFSSDIDLILAFPENGQTDGERPLANETFFARLGQMLVKLLAEITVDGYVYRVDLRLRPFGSAGRVALSFAAMEQYYQREGRDWERYAWIKSRPVAGDLVAGKQLIESLRPFVYRRYLDYTAFAGLREMKALIDAEVARKDMVAHLKLGPGGIREIEFVVQLLQLIRGGREPSLRVRGLLPALAACEQLGVITAARAKRLRDAYRTLRQIENRVQMLRDEQTHSLPTDAVLRARLAVALDYANPGLLDAAIVRVRADVTEEFAELLAPVRPQVAATDEAANAQAYWLSLAGDEASATPLLELGYVNAESLHGQLLSLHSSQAARAMSARAHASFDRLLPLLITAAAASVAADVCLDRLLRLVHAVMRRPAYLALIEEQPSSRARLVDVFADSALLAERVIAHPLLLDDVFDARIDISAPQAAQFPAQIERRLAHVDTEDAEAQIEVLQEEKHSAAFRFGLAYRSGSVDALATARGLSDTAQAIATQVLARVESDTARQHGRLLADPGQGGLAMIGYGSFGGAELGFASDLDLVFVYDGTLSQRDSEGARPLEGSRYFARIAQRVVHWLTTQTRAGQLYDVDVRLRPDGGKGLLVVSLDAFAEYQRERAWIWEQQALVRARTIAGDPITALHFDAMRRELLAQPRDGDVVREQIVSMRARWRSERDRSDARRLDLKQGAGALLDIEFLLQALVLMHARTHPQLLESGNSSCLIALMQRSGVLADAHVQNLGEAHALLLARSLACTLDLRPRLVARDADLERSARGVLAAAASVGLVFT